MRSYWAGGLRQRITRRRALAWAGAAAFLAACGNDGVDTPEAGVRPTATPGAAAEAASEPKTGGRLVWQGFGDPGGALELIATRNPGVVQLASLTHDGLLDFAYGQPRYPGIGNEVVPSLAQALPEISPDKLTITFKLRPAKFHNGRDLTSADALWTYETLAFAEESAWRGELDWLEGFEAPDDSTFVMKARFPNADTLPSLAFWFQGAILAREHHESGAAADSLMGSGPYLFVEYSPPSLTRYRRNPEYATDPGKPYFDEIERLGTSDSEKKVADFIGRQVHVTYWFPPEEEARIKAARQDIQVWQYTRPGSGTVYIRNDVPPYSDRRVRQALSMGYDRQPLIDSTLAGEGHADQVLSRGGEAWEFRGPEELPRADLYELNVAEARKLMAAASVTLPLKADIPHWNATVIGQKFVDEITLIAGQWRNSGLLDATQVEMGIAQLGPLLGGQYAELIWGPNTTSAVPNLGLAIFRKYNWPLQGVTPPTQNHSYVNIPRVTELVTAQRGEFDRAARIALFRELEENLSEEMVHCSGVTGKSAFIADQSVKNAQMPRDAFNGAVPWMKHWWFE
ncbi:MAG TPA: ABC transporter substrate-binding protein [Dehalococcoidia bacterium]|nr:ABC transporter substrate-binding protein [Dehalococcoidia bacterium]